MAASDFHNDRVRLAGYVALVERFGLRVMSNWHESYVATGGGARRVQVDGDVVRETYLPRYWPGETLGDHLEFALKYDGVNLGILAAIFCAMDTAELLAYLRAKPTGKYARRLWYLYELIIGEQLPIDDVDRGNYVPLLDEEAYVTTAPPKQVRRQRINDNLLGDGRLCPIVRRTEAVQRFMDAGFKERCQQMVDAYPPALLKRALSYLYTKETRSSFEIEHIKPDANRTERFIAQLQLAEREDFCEKRRLIELQNRIVDSRFAADDYRAMQNYIGETVALGQERIHFVAPKPEELPDLMAGLIESHRRMANGGVHPVVHAATVAYGFVFLHPFEDGNGRIHRFLIHNILARRGYTPDGLMFPVSAAMLNNPAEYDASLEAFSRALMPLVEYALDAEGQMTVLNETAAWYRFGDMTPQVEALFGFIEKTIETELVEELSFLVSYNRAKAAIQAVVDMPDRRIDLFIRFCLQNGGKLSSTKRASHFAFLTDDEVSELERAVREAYGANLRE